MSNLKIVFESEWHPWLFFTLVPLAAVALWFYFRVPKKYRRTRTRVTSLVLHLIVAVLCVSVLTGLTFTYEIPNEENEILILVDVSFSNSNTKAKHEMTADEFNSSVEGRKNKFIQDILAANGDSVFKVGIIAFARESHYVTGRVSSDAAWVSAKYEEFLSDPPEMDTSATNIGKALAFAKGKFEYEHSGKKVIVITDGVETDGSAIVAISALVAEDIKVDIVCFDEEIDGEVQISNIIMPNYGVAAGTAFLLSVQIDSTVEGTVSLTLYDNDVDCGSVDVDLVFGNQVIPMEHTFLGSGQHQLYIKVTSEVDTIKQNNHYYRYILLNVYDKILIIDKYNESKELLTLLNNEGSLSVVQAVDIHDAPTNLRTLSQYDQIILVNISNEDMTLLAPSGFIEMLHTYVHDFGGGLLTVGGNKYGLSEANAYGRLDMNPDGIPSLYQEMLPVQCIDYYPPLALVIVIDRSGSMSEIDMRSSKSRMELAKDAAKAAVAALSDRDYVGIISFSYTASVNIALTAATRKTDIERAINAIQPVGGTEYANALNLAGQALIGFTLAETKHVIFITDGEPTDSASGSGSNVRGYNYYIDILRENKISLSVISIIGPGGAGTATGPAMVTRAGDKGKAYTVDTTNVGMLTTMIRLDLELPAIKEYIPATFQPTILDHTPVVLGIDPAKIPTLNGFYGTRAKNKTKDNGLEVPLAAPFGVPLFARWQYGKGRVGSFMSDLKGTDTIPPDSWSYGFMNDPTETGPQLIYNMVKSLFPSEDIEIKDLTPRFTRDNYTVTMIIDTDLIPFDVVEVTVTDVTIIGSTSAAAFPAPVDVSSGMPRAEFVFPQPGIFKIEIVKTNTQTQGAPNTNTVYIEFSYSAEYNAFVVIEDVQEFLENLAAAGGGMVIPIEGIESDQGQFAMTAAEAALRDVKWVSLIPKNPWPFFLIAAIALFLLDIAARKFKFKWPWEMVQEHKLKKALKAKQ